MCGSLVTKWISQRLFGREPAGNLLTVAAVVFSSKSNEQIQLIFELLNLQFTAKTAFYSVQGNLVLPTINHFYHDIIRKQRLALLNKATLITGTGDGQCDSPGFSAVVLSGKPYEQIQLFSELLNLQFTTKKAFYSVQGNLVLPTINHFYHDNIREERQALLNKATLLTVTGDGQTAVIRQATSQNIVRTRAWMQHLMPLLVCLFQVTTWRSQAR